MDLFTNLTPIERLTKARIKLSKSRPFFALLVMKLKFREDKSIPSIAVDKYGNCIYNPDFIAKESDDALISDIAHEVLHCALEHLIRIKSRDMKVWNYVTDALINTILVKDGFKDINPDSWVMACHIPDKNGIRYTSEEILKHTAEEIYDSMPKRHKNGLGGLGNRQFDIHIFDDKYKDESNTSVAETKAMNDGRYWKKQLSEAFAYAKMRGKTPLGMERQLEKLLDNTIDWKGKLYKYITNLIPMDYTWKSPHKKSYSLKTYLPNVLKEKLEIIVDLDTSGSISQKQLTRFLSEIVGILRQFDNVEMTLLSSDTEVYNSKTIRNPTLNDIKKYKVKGGGGTDHKPVFKWIKKNKSNAQIVICFTDGYSSFPKPSDVRINTLWVLSEGKRENIPFGDIIELKESDE